MTISNTLRNSSTKNKILTLVVSTLIIQTIFLITALYFRTSDSQEVDLKIVKASESLTGVGLQDEILAEISDSQPTIAKNEYVDNSKIEEIEVVDSFVPAVSHQEGAPEVIIHTVSAGDTLMKIWQDYDGSYEDSHTGAVYAAEAFKKVNRSPSSLRKGEEIEIQRDADGRITALKKSFTDGSSIVLDGNSAQGFEASLIEPRIITKDRKVSSKISSSLAVSAQQLNISYDVIDQLVDIFGGKVLFSRDIRQGDSFTVHYEERLTEDGKSIASGPIKAASLMLRGKFIAAIRWVDEQGKAHYVDEEGQKLGNYFLRYPVKFTRISSVFSKSRFHPVLKRSRPHNGVDFAAPTGTPVRSVGDGVVVDAGYRGGAGNLVKIKHNDKYATAYMHLSKISKGIKKGAKVSRGQVIGGVGKTGLATGPHLHFSFYVDNRYVDPFKINLPQVSSSTFKAPKDKILTLVKDLKSSHKDTQIALAESDTQEIG